MASAAGDPLESAKDLCVDILDCCAQIQTVLLKLKESLLRKDAAVRLQAAAHGFLARRRAQVLRADRKVMWMLPLSAREVDQQPQSGCPKDRLFPIAVCVRCCLVTTLLQSAVHSPGGISMVWLTSPTGADQLQLLGMHLHGKIKKSGSPGHAATPRRRPPRARMHLEPWPPPDHHSSRASCLRRREEMLCVQSTVHAVNSNRVQILGKIRLDWFVISLNLEIGFLRVKSAHLYKDGIVSLLIKQ